MQTENKLYQIRRDLKESLLTHFYFLKGNELSRCIPCDVFMFFKHVILDF